MKMCNNNTYSNAKFISVKEKRQHRHATYPSYLINKLNSMVVTGTFVCSSKTTTWPSSTSVDGRKTTL